MINFPSNPTVGDEYTFAGRTWVFGGIGWNYKPSQLNAAQVQEALGFIPADTTALANAVTVAQTAALSAEEDATSTAADAAEVATAVTHINTKVDEADGFAADALSSKIAAEAFKDAAATSATDASNSADGAATSASNAAASAASAAAALDSFDDRYLGSKTSSPTTDNDGNVLVEGALFYNSTLGKMFVWDGTAWIAASAASEAILSKYKYIATASQTTFSGAASLGGTLAYTVGSILVTLNGVVLDPSDYTASNGTSIVLTAGASVDDELVVYAFSTFNVANTYTQSQTNALLDAKQPLDPDLTAIAALTGTSGTLKKTAANTWTLDTSTGAFLPLTGGTLTGPLTAPAYRETRVALPANNIDLALGNYFTKSISAATTLTVSNTATAGLVSSFILDLTNGGAFAITWWANVKWAGGTAPTLTASGRDCLGFFTHNAGATWTGLVLGKDVK